jgi:hypothetical protein
MPKASLRNASIFSLAVWVGIWVLFLLMRLSPFDYRDIPGIGAVLLIALAVALLAPIVAAGLAAAALVRQPQAQLNWLTLGCAMAALIGQIILFGISRWM